MGEWDRWLVMLTVQLLRGPRRPLDGTANEISALLQVLRAHYADAGTPYGATDPGFQRWLLDQWPAPPMA